MLKPKKCKDCGEEFQPFKSMQPRCYDCAREKGRKDTQKQLKREQEASRKAFNKETKLRKDKMKTRSEWMKDAQRAFNRFIRLRDYHEPCISCDKPSGTTRRYLTGSSWDCGHYRSVGSAPELRFEELNAAKQCVKCNQHLSGNVVEYRKRLILKIGTDKLDWLEGPHEAKKYTVDDLKELKQKYAKLARELEKEINN